MTGRPAGVHCHQQQQQQPDGVGSLRKWETSNVHPSQDVWIDASRGGDDALEHVWVFLGALQQAPEHRQHLEAHDLLVLVRECRGREGLGDEVGSPAPQLEGGVWGGEGQDAVHDRLVVAGVDEDGLAGIIQLLELLAHGLHSVGGHDGRVGWHDGLDVSWMGVKRRHTRSAGLKVPLLYETKWEGNGWAPSSPGQISETWWSGQKTKASQ